MCPNTIRKKPAIRNDNTAGTAVPSDYEGVVVAMLKTRPVRACCEEPKHMDSAVAATPSRWLDPNRYGTVGLISSGKRRIYNGIVSSNEPRHIILFLPASSAHSS